MNNLKAIVTSGPTIEKIDPVRYLSNFSSGKQGHSIASALATAGIDVTLISGPTNIPAPSGVHVINVTSAQEMLQACQATLPADIAICAAAVCDFRPAEPAQNKLKKQDGVDELTITLVKNPDILKTLSTHTQRPKLVIGFAAETNNLVENATRKLANKQCDWILANDVSNNNVFGQDGTHLHFITANGCEDWGASSKDDAATRLVERVRQFFSPTGHAIFT